ncbi:hypothetical protein MSPP1_001459 [Malassezia sp. CBS 17886]|nr:hypothetical protein MSPP1_001459 [Malassezia sp. CBS 17886]
MPQTSAQAKAKDRLSVHAPREKKPKRPPKVFSEDQGTQHLLALTQQAVAKKDTQYGSRVERSRAPTRTTMMSLLKEKRREKTRERKLSRKQREATRGEQGDGREEATERTAARPTSHTQTSDPAAPSDSPRSILKTDPQRRRNAKRVSFG